MRDSSKTKTQLIRELNDLRDRLKDQKEKTARLEKIEKVLFEIEEQYLKLFNSSLDAVMTLAPPTWHFTSGNARILDIFKVESEEEFTSLGPWEISPERQPDGQLSMEKARKMIALAMEKGSHFFEWTHKRKSGELFPASVLLTRINLENKTFLQATVRDLSELKEEREKLIIFKNAVEFSHDAIGMSTPEGKHWYQNLAFDQLFGKIDENPQDSVYVDRKVGNEVFKTIMNGNPWVGEVKLYGKNKEILDILLQAYPIEDISGNIITLVGVHSNITEQKKAENALRESQARFKSVTKNMMFVMVYQVMVDPEGNRKFTYVSDNIEQTNEVSAEAVLNDPMVLYKQIPPDYIDDLMKAEQAAIEKMTPFHYTIPFRLPSGKNRWFQLASIPHPLQDGSIVWDGVQIDITEQKEIQKALQAQKDFTANILEGTNAGIWQWDIREGKTTINERWANIIGYTLEELSPVDSSTLDRFIHPEDAIQTKTMLENHIRGDSEYYNVVFRLAHKNGGYVWVNSRGKIIERDQNGNPVRMSGTHIDITDRMVAEEELKKTRNYIQNIIDSMPSMLIGVTDQGIINQWNREAEKRFGIISKDACGRSVTDILPHFSNELQRIKESIQKQEILINPKERYLKKKY